MSTVTGDGSQRTLLTNVVAAGAACNLNGKDVNGGLTAFARCFIVQTVSSQTSGLGHWTRGSLSDMPF